MKPTELEFHVGHFGDGTGAAGYVDEVKYARRFIKRIYDIVRASNVPATYYEDTVSKNKTDNVNRLIAHHNADYNGLIVSGHLNASALRTERGIGVEVLYKTQKEIASNVSKAISASSGLIDRGAKYRDDVGVLVRTNEPGILIEFGFVNSKKDVELMDANFEKICQAVAKVLAEAIGHKLKTSTVTTSKQVPTHLDEKVFTSPTLQEATEFSLRSPARRKLIVDLAVANGAGKVWQKKLEEGTITQQDIEGLAVMACVNIAKKK